MNKFNIFSIVISIFLLSCEDIFHEPETSIGDIQNEEELIQAAEGVWGKLNWAINYPDPLSFYYQNLKGDDLTFRGANYRNYYDEDETCYSIYEDSKFIYSKHSTYLYESFYQVIASINNILNQYPVYNEQPELVKGILGEMLLLRAYCYFRLTRTYGRIPLVTDIEVQFNTNFSTFEQVYNKIETDLKIASDLLPQTSQISRIPNKRPGKASARALLAEVYLFWAGYPIKDIEKYKLSAEVAGGLIDSAEYYGVGLLDDFEDLWDSEQIVNKESILSLYFPSSEHITELDQINRLYSQDNIFVSSPSFLRISRAYYDQSIGKLFLGNVESAFYATEVQFFNNYPEGYRKSLTFFSDIYVPTYLFSDQIQDTGYVHLNSISNCCRVGYRKFHDMNGKPFLYSIDKGELYYTDTIYSISNVLEYYAIDKRVILYRFAHTLLTYAEANARLGLLDDKTYEAVNRIRRRANNVDQFTPSIYDLSTGLTPEVFADSVVWERAWELAGEPEGRYFDLLRLEKLEDLSKYRHPKEDSPPWHRITKEDYFLPIPDKVIN